MSNENSQKISDFFPWSENSFGIALNDFILCLDKLSTSGEFVFLQLLLSRIRTGATIRLIACNHSEQHYISILRKNVSSACADCCPLLFIKLYFLCAQNIDVQRLQNSGKLEIVRVSNQVGQGSNWDELVQWQKLLTSSSDQYTVFVDDLEALELLSPTPMTARRFISHFIHELGGDSPRLLNLVAFGRQSYEHEAPFDGLDFGAAQIDSYGGMNNEPSLCNYALYRYLFMHLLFIS